MTTKARKSQKNGLSGDFKMKLKSQIKIMHGWRTEWCSHMPFVDGDAQVDEATWTYHSFRTLEEAKEHAHEILTKHNGGEFGCVQIDEFQWVPMRNHPLICEFELIGETLEVTP